jgi:hypothetical protein
MEAAMMALTSFPEAHPRRDALGKGFRVLHGARDAAAIAESGGFSGL